MVIEKTLSSCVAIYNYASNSSLVHVFVLLLFFIMPFSKIFFSVLKTTKKVNRVKLECRQSLPTKLQKVIKKHNLSHNLFLVSCAENLAAVSVGFFSKKIILSKKLISILTINELEAVILHELFHTKFNHSFILFIVELLANTLFFFPFLKDVQISVKSQLEKSADQYAVLEQKTTKYIKDSLKKIIVLDNDYGFFPNFSLNIIEQRIDNLNSKKTNFFFHPKRMAFSVVSFSVLIFIFFLNGKYAMASVMEEKIQCEVFDCVKECVSNNIINKQLNMSKNNFSINNDK